MARERIQQKAKKNTKHRKSVLKRCFLWLAVAIILFFGFGFLSRLPGIQVSSGVFENMVVTNELNVKRVVDEYLGGRFLYPRSNIVWFSERKIERYIKNNFPRLGRVDVSIVPKRTIKVWVQEREGAHLWCGQEIHDVTVDDSQCYFADESGFIFDRAPFFAGASFLRFYGGDFENSPIGNSLVDISIVDSHRAFEGVLANYNFEIQAIWDRGDGQVEFILLSNNEISQAPRVRHFIGNDLELVLSDVVSALADDSVLLDIQENYDRLEYIDTRFTGQFIYKFFDVVSEQPIQEVVEQEYVEVSEENTEEESEIEVEESTEG